MSSKTPLGDEKMFNSLVSDGLFVRGYLWL